MKTPRLIVAFFAILPILSADQIKVADTEVTFEVPEDFKPLSREVIAVKCPTDRAPAFAVGTSSGATTVAYDLRPYNIPQEALPEVQKSFTALFERMIPGIAWRKMRRQEKSSHDPDTPSTSQSRRIGLRLRQMTAQPGIRATDALESFGFRELSYT